MYKPEVIRVLYVCIEGDTEDNAAPARKIRQMLEQNNCSVESVCGKKEGPETYRTGHHDAVILTQNTPPTDDDMETLAALASGGPPPPIIVLARPGTRENGAGPASNRELGAAVNAIKLGAYDYIVEDDDGAFIELLLPSLERALAQKLHAEEKRNAEQAARERKRLYRRLFDVATDAIIIENAGEKIIDVNSAACKLFGYTREEMLSMRTSDLEPPDVRELPPRPVYSSGDLNAEERFETVLMNRDGIRIPVEISITQMEAGLFLSIIRDITEWKHVEEQLRQHNRELAMFNRASQALSSTLQLDQVLVTVLEEVRRMMDVVACSIWLFDPDTGKLVCRQATGPQGEVVRGWRLEPGEGIVGWVAEHGEGLVVPDVREEERYSGNVDEKTGLNLRSILSIPLKLKESTIGVIQVLDTMPGYFKKEHLTLLEPLAASAAISIENAWLYEQARKEIEARKKVSEQLKRSNERLAMLQQINAVIHSGLPLNRVLRLIVENIRQGLRYPGVLICIPDEGRKELVIRAAGGQLDRFLNRREDIPTRRIAFPLDDTDNPMVSAISKQHFRETDAAPWLSAIRKAGVPEMAELLESMDVKHGVALPMWQSDQPENIIGVLGVLKAEDRASRMNGEGFLKEEMQLLNSVTWQAALAVNSARLFLAERQGRREMEALYRAGIAITSAQTVQDVLRAIIEQIVELVGVESCAIYRCGGERNDLITELSLDRKGDEWKEHAPPGTLAGLAGRPTLRRVLTQQSVVSLQEDEESTDPQEKLIMKNEGIKSRLILPLVLRDRSVGILELAESRHRRNFTAHDIRISQGLAMQAVVSIENARLHLEKLEQMENELELAQRIQYSLLPQQAPQVAGLEIAARSIAARQVGGDFYRYLPLSDGRFGLAIGDVSGKGVPSALFMAMTITAIDTQIHKHTTPNDLLDKLNSVLYPQMRNSHMNTGLLVAIFEKDRGIMHISNAGMIAPLVTNGDAPTWLDVSGLPIGAIPLIHHKRKDVPLGDGTTIVFASDGIVEAMNNRGELFGFERVQGIVGEMRGEKPDVVLEGIWHAVSEHIGETDPHDDMTLIVVRSRP